MLEAAAIPAEMTGNQLRIREIGTPGSVKGQPAAEKVSGNNAGNSRRHTKKGISLWK
jgi:hypothetical protein